MKDTILIVDDAEINRLMLSSLLEDDYDILEADNGEKAFDLIVERQEALSLVLLDIIMPGLNGYEVLKKLKAQDITNIPVIIVTAADDTQSERTGLALGAVDYISKPFDPEIVKSRVDTQVSLKRYRDHLEHLVDENVKMLTAFWSSMIHTLADVIEYRNGESGQHVKRTCIIAEILLRELYKRRIPGYLVTEKDVEQISETTGLHDIGKIGISDTILLKPGKLTDQEFAMMKRHTVIGEQIAGKFVRDRNEMYWRYCREICRHHHEWWNGMGYPDGLSGTHIPLSARVAALGDVYDALTSKRVYKSEFSHQKAIEIIREESGTHFDPILVDVFVEMADVIAESVAQYRHRSEGEWSF